MTLKDLRNVCAKSEPASSKSNEILEINVMQKLTSHALCEKNEDTDWGTHLHEKLVLGQSNG